MCLDFDLIGSSISSDWLLLTFRGSYILGSGVSNAVCASDWTCGLAHAKKIVSDGFSGSIEWLC